MATKVTWPPNFLIVAFRLIGIRRNVILYSSVDINILVIFANCVDCS